MALGKSLVAQLQANDENGVSLILWDTSGDDNDVNINAVLRDKLCGHSPGDVTFDDMPPLEFPGSGKTVAFGMAMAWAGRWPRP